MIADWSMWPNPSFPLVLSPFLDPRSNLSPSEWSRYKHLNPSVSSFHINCVNFRASAHFGLFHLKPGQNEQPALSLWNFCSDTMWPKVCVQLNITGCPAPEKTITPSLQPVRYILSLLKPYDNLCEEQIVNLSTLFTIIYIQNRVSSSILTSSCLNLNANEFLESRGSPISSQGTNLL